MKGDTYMKKSLLRIAAALVLTATIAGLFGGCKKEQAAAPQNEGKGPFPVTIRDFYGTEITIDEEPQRIVALAPSIVEVLYELGLGDKIVGVTDYCDYPLEAADKEKIGGFNGVNLEKVVELKPDLVLAGTASKEVFEKLTSLNIHTIVAEPRTLSEITESFMIMGRAVGAEDKAKALVERFNGRIDEIKDKVKDAPKVKVYYAMSFGEGGNWTAGKGTFISDLIDIAGGENIADDVNGWKEYSIEQIIEKDPEVIFLSNMVAAGNKDALDNEKGYKETAAVKNDRVLVLDDINLVERPGPRITEGLELIAKELHPEIFGK